MNDPTDDEIDAARAAARRVLSEYPTAEVTLTVALAAALPLVEARLREQIAGEAVAEIGRLRAAMAVARTVLQTLRWMIEEGGHDSIKLREGCLAIDAILRDALTPDTD